MKRTSSYSMELLIDSTKCNQPLDCQSNSDLLSSHVYGTSWVHCFLNLLYLIHIIIYIHYTNSLVWFSCDIPLLFSEWSTSIQVHAKKTTKKTTMSAFVTACVSLVPGPENKAVFHGQLAHAIFSWTGLGLGNEAMSSFPSNYLSLLYYCLTVLLSYCTTVLLYYCLIVLLPYCPTVLLYLPYYHLTVL